MDCLTDNLNRSVSDLRTVLNKTHTKMGAMGSVSYMYDNLCVVGVKGLSEEEVMDALIEEDIDIDDIEAREDEVVVYGTPQDLFKIKEALNKTKKDIEFTIDEFTKLPKETITLSGEDLELFNKMLSMLDEVEDVQNVYHNVNL